MFLIAHIVKKDLRRLWFYLAVWWTVLAVKTAVPAWEFSNFVAGGERTWLEIFEGALVIADLALTVVIIRRLIWDDSAFSDRAHWRTLAVSGRRMFAAKMLFIGLFCLGATMLASLAMKLVYHLPTAEWLDEFSFLSLQQFALIVGVMMVSSLAIKFSYPGSWRIPLMLVLIVVLCALEAVLWRLRTRPFLPLILPVDNDVTPDHARYWLSSLLVVATGLAASWTMFARHRQSSAYRVLVVGLVFAFNVLLWWPTNFGVAPASLQPLPQSGFRFHVAQRFMSGPGFSQLGPVFDLQAIHDGVAANPREVLFLTATETITGAADSRRESKIWVGNPLGQLINRDEVLAALGFGAGRMAPSSNRPLLTTSFPRIDQTDNVVRNEKLKLNLTGYALVGRTDLPLTDRFKFSWQYAPYFTVLESKKGWPVWPPEADKLGNKIDFRATIIAPQAALAGPYYYNPRKDGQYTVFLLWNPKSGEFVVADSSEYRAASFSGHGSAFFAQDMELTFNLGKGTIPPAAGQPTAEENRAWLADAHLVQLRFAPTRQYYAIVPIETPALANN